MLLTDIMYMNYAMARGKTGERNFAEKVNDDVTSSVETARDYFPESWLFDLYTVRLVRSK